MSLVGSFLVARPGLTDTTLQRAVVLVLGHSSRATWGVIVNRPAPAQGDLPVWDGGPCKGRASTGIVLHAHRDWAEATRREEGDPASPDGKEVAPGIFLGDLFFMIRVHHPLPGESYIYRLFAGHVRWQPGQLEQEVADGCWGVVPADDTLFFDTPPAALWEQLSVACGPNPCWN